ncbi:aa3-type cytochrome oxidase subunit IV [Allostreptomyces psammosilenae]|uniref:Cytochrome c oxidase polypeptide 4 n=1 Tax=Allostreptomyces psammosilenae TaxID=1892865 RepID=A0A852ZPY2_9ACTN|nr:cytochrome c oxidase subunit 4 [Allostreptomyces psammosilenae]NYI03805.1 hypothetical protein [Allostreptomyces psammosilenae]
MRVEGHLFGGVAGFFAGVAAVYWLLARDPAGTAVLLVCGLMSALIAYYLFHTSRRSRRRLEDRADAEVVDGAGRLAFFPPGSAWPVVTAAGVTLLALGLLVTVWLVLVGVGVLALGVSGFVLQHNPPHHGG